MEFRFFGVGDVMAWKVCTFRLGCVPQKRIKAYKGVGDLKLMNLEHT